MTQVENPRPVTDGATDRASDRDAHQHNGVSHSAVPHSGGPIMHRRDASWQDDVFDLNPSELDPH